MPPRTPGVQRLNTVALCLRPAVKPSPPPFLPITQTASVSDKVKRRLAKQDPYRWAQMQQRKNAHLEIRREIEASQREQAGDPIHGIPTPFLESFDSAGQAPFSKPRVDEDGNPIEEPHPLPTSPHVLNNLVSQSEFDLAVENAYSLTRPIDSDYTRAHPGGLEKMRKDHDEKHAKAVEAVQRILDLGKGSAKDRRHANIRRCIETFGRHETDVTLPPKPLSRGQEREERPVRGGPDTGSSEVQIAILTVKIRALAGELAKNRGHKDKVGKRDLRLMVHKRQRLLTYMERKERGSARWRHMVQQLGLTDATYKGQITV
ncbi:putative ribosomal protein S15 [Rosellinia necatrix]|uniref:Putative ribosomal protein S15 n=1 Tax=Rosellinia necatrix TaxID=77044 RepID=A0A1W2TWR9_ROSNE|nr:putative ribosomal protein S15 [Rosellinia necatrix]